MNDLPMAIQAVPTTVAAQESGRFYVDFEIRVEEDREASIKAGHFVGKDVPFAIITLPGGKDVRRRPVTEELLKEWEHGRWRGEVQLKPPAPWAIHAFRKWQQGQEIPENGWPLRHWNALTPAQLKTCIAANVRTVEDLAALNDEGVKRLGIGGLQLVRLAKEALKQKGDQKNTHKVVALEQQVERLTQQVQELARVNSTLKKQIETGVAPPAADIPVYPEMPVLHGFGQAGNGNGANADDMVREEYAAEYERIFGKKPHGAMKTQTMRERIRKAREN